MEKTPHLSKWDTVHTEVRRTGRDVAFADFIISSEVSIPHKTPLKN